MVFKSLSRLDGGSSTEQLLEYIIKEKTRERVPEKLIFRHNVFGKTIEEMRMEFEKNEANRLYKSGRRVSNYHEIISFHNYDRDKLLPHILQEISEKYFELRNPNALFVVTAHIENNKEIHLHACVSGTSIDGRSLRISRDDFQKLKEDLQAFQIAHFPELQNSIVDFSKASKLKIKDNEFQVIKREGKSEKQMIKENLEKLFTQSKSKTEFYEKIKESYQMYSRGKHDGLTSVSGRNLRLSSLGFDTEKLQELNQREQTLHELKSIRENQLQHREIQTELLDRDISLNFIQTSSLVSEPITEIEEKEKDENDIEINFYPRTNSFDLEL